MTPAERTTQPAIALSDLGDKPMLPPRTHRHTRPATWTSRPRCPEAVYFRRLLRLTTLAIVAVVGFDFVSADRLVLGLLLIAFALAGSLWSPAMNQHLRAPQPPRSDRSS